MPLSQATPPRPQKRGGNPPSLRTLLLRRRGAFHHGILPRLHTGLSLLPWLAMVSCLASIAGLRGFRYPVGSGWVDDVLDVAGILLALSGVVLARAVRASGKAPRPWLAPELWALGAGFGLVLGQLGLTLLFLVLYVLTGLQERGLFANLLTRKGQSLWKECLTQLVCASNLLCAITALGVLLMVWEVIAAPGGASAHRLELGILGCLLALLGLVWTARADGLPRGAQGESGPYAARRWQKLLGTLGVLSIIGFGLLAWMVRFDAVQAWDAEQSSRLHNAGGPAVTEAMRAISDAGGKDLAYYWLPLAVLVVGIVGRGKGIRFLLFTVMGSPCLGLVMKVCFHRARPETTHGLQFDSFPSSHTFSAAVFAAALVSIFLPRCRRFWQRNLLLAAGCAWPLLMAVSRVYVGSHFPTDVAAGLLLGGAWVSLCGVLVAVLAPRLTKQHPDSSVPGAPS